MPRPVRSILIALLVPIWAAAAQAEDSFVLRPGEIITEDIGADVDMLTYHVRVRPARNADTHLTLYWNYGDSAYHTRAEVSVPSMAADDGITAMPVGYSVVERTAGADSMLCSGSVAAMPGAGSPAGMSVVLQATASGARLLIGAHKAEAAVVVPFRCRNAAAVGLSADRPVEVLRNSIMLAALPPREYRPTDGAVTTWRYLDRNTQPGGAPPAAYYTIGLVPEADGTTAIIYLGGSTEGWQPGQVKGRLRPTAFRNHYDLEWLDSRGRRVADEAYASVSDDGHILELNFPLYKSQIRFRRL